MYKVYEKMPVLIQNIICSLYGYKEKRIRFNKNFEQNLKNFIVSDHSTESEILKIKTEKLINILLFGKRSGLYPELENIDNIEISTDPFAILAELPILSKDEVRCFDLTSLSGKASSKKIVTSGTTGKALSLLKSKTAFSAQWAIWFRHRARFGVKLGQLSVNFSGKPLVPLSQSGGPYWRFNRAQNQYLISMQHINSDTIESIVAFLNTIKPEFYSGYPSIIAEVARLAFANGHKLIEPSKPRVIFTGAEKLLSNQEYYIKEWLGSEVITTDQYGLTEGNCNFSKCEKNNYHEDFEFCHIEIADGETLEDGSIRGRLIGTAFYSDAMPLIRYDTGDIAVMASKSYKCSCGRDSRVILEVDGRADDYILLPNNRRVMRFDYLFKDTFEVLEAQVIQTDLLSVKVLAVLQGGASSKDFEKKVRAHFVEYIHKDFAIDFSYVDKIPRSVTGKFKAVVNRLDKI